MRIVREHVVLSFKVLGVTHQVTNRLLERPGAEAQQLVMFADCVDRQLSDRPSLVVDDHLAAEPRSS